MDLVDGKIHLRHLQSRSCECFKTVREALFLPQDVRPVTGTDAGRDKVSSLFVLFFFFFKLEAKTKCSCRETANIGSSIPSPVGTFVLFPFQNNPSGKAARWRLGHKKNDGLTRCITENLFLLRPITDSLSSSYTRKKQRHIRCPIKSVFR